MEKTYFLFGSQIVNHYSSMRFDEFTDVVAENVQKKIGLDGGELFVATPETKFGEILSRYDGHGAYVQIEEEEYNTLVDMLKPDFKVDEEWAETHYEMVAAIEDMRRLEEIKQPDLIKWVNDNEGTGGFWELAQKWTNEFQEKHRYRVWDGEFFDAIELFVEDKLSQFVNLG